MGEEFSVRKESVNPVDQEMEQKLRPLVFEDFKGQARVVENLKVFVTAASRRKRLLTMCCCMVRPDWEKQHLPVL